MDAKLHRAPVKLFILGGVAVVTLLTAGGWLLWSDNSSAAAEHSPATLHKTDEETPTSPPDWDVPDALPAESADAGAIRSVSPRSPAAEWIGKSAESLKPPHLPLVAGKTGWESQIDAILAENVPDHMKAERLLRRLPSLPEEAYARATEEAVRRLRDRDYSRVVSPLIIHPNTHGAIMSVLFADLLERPDEIAIPTLADIAEQSDHPFAKSAEDDLDLLVDKKQPGWAEKIARMRAALKYKPAEISE